MARFAETSCSQCGRSFGPGDSGFSHCIDHPPYASSVKPDDDHIDDCVDTLICPVTGNPCMTEHDEFCEDYGCARKAGIDVEREW